MNGAVCIYSLMLFTCIFIITESKSKQDASRRQSTSSRGSAGSGRERDHTESRRGETTTPSSGYESRCSSGLSVDMNALQENINVMDIDSIAQSLRYVH